MTTKKTPAKKTRAKKAAPKKNPAKKAAAKSVVHKEPAELPPLEIPTFLLRNVKGVPVGLQTVDGVLYKVATDGSGGVWYGTDHKKVPKNKIPKGLTIS